MYDTSAHCVLCPNEGGALKKTQYGCKWVHVSCALWIPEVGIGDIDKMEPITKVEDIPVSTIQTMNGNLATLIFRPSGLVWCAVFARRSRALAFSVQLVVKCADSVMQCNVIYTYIISNGFYKCVTVIIFISEVNCG